METERSPLKRESFPRYTFLGSGSQPKKNIKKLQCWIYAVCLALLVLIMVIILTYYLSSDSTERFTNSSKVLDDLLQLKFPLRERQYVEKNLSDSHAEQQAFNEGVAHLEKRDLLEDRLPSVPIDSPLFRHHLATFTSNKALAMSRLGFVFNVGTKALHKCCSNFSKQEWSRWAVNQSQVRIPNELCNLNETLTCQKLPYRSSNGTCNNLINKTWGAALQPFRRILLPEYDDGVSAPRRGSNGNDLPSAREVSLAIHRPVYKSDVNFTVMLAVWGQFIDHDITATAISKGKNGLPINCCATRYNHPECFPVFLNKSDPFYLKYKILCMDFVRSAPAPICSFGPREQLNQVTSFLDGSVVYGNDDVITNQLRSFTGGELRMLNTFSGQLLPLSENPDDGCNREEEFRRGRYCFLSGDARANENLLLTSMHLLFARQHNNLARKLSQVNPAWSDEKVFQETRKIVSAQIQHITYNEFLPSVLPRELLKRLNISLKGSGYFRQYNSSINPSISNVFASAAFRFGHSLLPGLMRFLHNNASEEEYLELHKMLFNPFELYKKNFLENFMSAATITSSEKSDVYVSGELTQKLFQKNKGPCGLDLVSLNIQRGRDHGLPSYPHWRVACGHKMPNSFEDLKNDIEPDTLEKLQKLYKSVYDLDLYTGALAEKPIGGGLVGPTITCLLADQFLRLKIGDRFWYETEEEPQRFTPQQLQEIRKTSLAKIICLTSEVERIQPFVMRGVGADNQMQLCNMFSYIDLEVWKEI